ncbi:MAG: pyrroline-5-carboxylate reductase [Pseudomonadota bacterium]|nr:pyrroline-5-carboxylate reductase [Pseudomonadota bacterium]
MTTILFPTITFIGGGNMASSLIGGLIADGCPANNITVAEPDTEKLAQLHQAFGVHTHTDNNMAAASAQVIMLAVKPQIMQSVCCKLANTIQQKKPLIISIAAGIRTRDMDRWLGNNNAIVRCMPNTPALLRCGATGLFANNQVDAKWRDIAQRILSSAGLTLWVEKENLIDVVTAVSGSGPAYFFLLMESMIAAGEKLGLEARTAQQLTLQTALGAARMAQESDVDTATLRARVTSKGGTTEAAIKHFQQNHFEQLVKDALAAASHRAGELADILGKDS